MMEVEYSPESKADALNKIEAAIHKLPRPQNFYRLFAVPGMLAKEGLFQPGQWIISEIHGTNHIWNLSAGSLDIYTEDEGIVILQAPEAGITKAGTRRLAQVREDAVIWTCYHTCPYITDENWDKLTNEELLDIEKKMFDEIIIHHENPYLIGKDGILLHG